jgi:NADP-dependent 3-hydroxy acid dehydrogenase YdfG
MANDLAGQVAVITGASSGIGTAVARDLAEAGVRLVLTARSSERLSALAAELAAIPVAGDITDPHLPSHLLDRAVAAYGRCDIALNNAGCIEVGDIASVDIDKICSMVRVNVEAAYRVAYVFARHFVSRNEGRLINMSSVLGTKVRPTAGAYAGTKYAIEALSEAMRMELAATNVHVICVEPGLVFTGLHAAWPVHPTKSMNIPNPLQPADVARAIRFALSQPPHVRIPKLMILPDNHSI